MHQLKIIVVDDDEDFCNIAGGILARAKHNVICLGDERSLIDKIPSYGPDLIFMRMIQKHIDGRELCRQIKANENMQQLRLLITSVYPSAAEECINAGADGFLKKPFTSIELLNAVNSLFEG